MTKNQAAWLTEARATPFKVDDAPVPKPGPGEVLIKNSAVAINPVDWKIQKYGVFIKNYPTILGTDVAGVIEEVGDGVTQFQKGQRVIGHLVGLLTGDTGSAAFQLYSKTTAILVARIPDALSFEQAVVLPLALSTASAGLYQPGFLELPFPSLSPQPANKTLVVWGGASSVGATAIQLATASGLKVVATASARNHEFVKALGAVAVVDYKKESVVEDVVRAVEEAGGAFAGVYDAISDAGSLKLVGGVTDRLGAAPVALVLPPPEGLTKTIEAKQVFAPTIGLQQKHVGEAVWGKFVPEALASGQLKAKPDALVIGKGLEKVQDGLDRQQAGVSAQKVVISL